MKPELQKPDPRRRLLLAGGALAMLGMGYARLAWPHDDHHHHAGGQELKRSEAYYKIPAATLVRDDGVEVAFPRELDDGRPVIVDFVYTSCTTVCPVTSMVFSQLQGMLGERPKMVSISIDPEYDTPQRLQQYARKFAATEHWRHYTGSREAIVAVQKAFNAYRGDKMNHFAVTFLRAAPGQPWVRLEGFASAEDLAQEYRRLLR